MTMIYDDSDYDDAGDDDNDDDNDDDKNADAAQVLKFRYYFSDFLT